MKRGPFIILAVAVAVVAVWEFWLFPAWTIRYRMTVDVAVGDQIKTGSGVIETVWHDQWLPLPLGPMGVPWLVDVRGEAVSVDLGARGILFALTDRDETRWSRNSFSSATPPSFLLVAFSSYKSIGPGNATRQLLSEIEHRRDVVEVPLAVLPMLVRFRDIKDPTSVQRIEPNDLTEAFGPDVKLVRVTAQVVPSGHWPFNQSGLDSPKWLFGVPVTTGIENRLPWLRKGNPEKWLVEPHGEPVADVPPEKRLTYSAFIRGMWQ